jgi:phosphoethanolamine N-methyltransferase
VDEPATQEYDDKLTALLEALWGEGFLSPGGIDEVDRYLAGIKLESLAVLDIGCGLGGVDIHLVRQHHAGRVTGIDIDPALIDRCRQLAEKSGVGSQTEFICVEPGRLTFADASFDAVTSKDSIIHIPDKQELAEDVFRVLRPGGWFAASDWLAGYDNEPSAEMQAYLVAEGLDFGLATAEVYQQALAAAGFTDLDIVDRNDWYRQHAHHERDRLEGALYEGLVAETGTEFVDHEIEVWEKMIVALEQGQLRPTHLRGRKPDQA